MGPKWAESWPAITVTGATARARIDIAKESQRFMGRPPFELPPNARRDSRRSRMRIHYRLIGT